MVHLACKVWPIWAVRCGLSALFGVLFGVVHVGWSIWSFWAIRCRQSELFGVDNPGYSVWPVRAVRCRKPAQLCVLVGVVNLGCSLWSIRAVRYCQYALYDALFEICVERFDTISTLGGSDCFLSFVATRSLARVQVVLPPIMPSANGDRMESRVKMTRMRMRIAERLKSAQNTAAMLTTFQEVRLNADGSFGQYRPPIRFSVFRRYRPVPTLFPEEVKWVAAE